jgi:hypothetical protein
MPFGLFAPRPAAMAPDADDQEIDVEDVLSKLNLDEKISLLSGLC